jgi:tRNA-dihydrouridine synthase A
MNRTFSIAPMMEWSDRHCRYFWRLLSKEALLYTEMVTTGALIHGDRQRFLTFNPEEHPLALQVGGSNPRDLAECARMAEDWGYDEINLNCGCPSDRVQQGKIGACLMGEPDLVAECVAAMTAATRIPVTVKHRIGIDDMDDYQAMRDFVARVAAAGCGTFIVHARKAWLKGLSPKENREVPPLQYDRVYQLKREFPELSIVINGGITTLEQCQELLKHVDGVMIGREAYHNPYLIAGVDAAFFDHQSALPSRIKILTEYIAYCDRQLADVGRLHPMSRHILGLFLGQPGARAFRRHISTFGVRSDAGTEVLRQAAEFCQSNASPEMRLV